MAFWYLSHLRLNTLCFKEIFFPESVWKPHGNFAVKNLHQILKCAKVCQERHKIVLISVLSVLYLNHRPGFSSLWESERIISDAFDNDKGKSIPKLPYGWIHTLARWTRYQWRHPTNSRRREEFFNYVAKLCMSLIYLIKKYIIMLCVCNYVSTASTMPTTTS